MSHDLPTPAAPTGVAWSVNLHHALAQEYPAIQQRIDGFLVQLGGWPFASAELAHSVTALRRHIYVEEEFLFPPLREAGMVGPVYAMSADHQDLWRSLVRVEEHLNDASSYEVQQESCRILAAQLDRHTSREDPVVFEHVDDVLSPQAMADLRAFVENATPPPGWTCPEPTYN